jgi:hypothetical protein
MKKMKKALILGLATAFVLNCPLAYAATGAGKYISALERVDGMKKKEAMQTLTRVAREFTDYAIHNPNAQEEIRAELLARGYTEAQLAKVEEFQPRVNEIMTDSTLTDDQKNEQMKDVTLAVAQVLKPATGSLSNACQVMAWGFLVGGVGGVTLLIAGLIHDPVSKPMVYGGLAGIGVATVIFYELASGLCG